MKSLVLTLENLSGQKGIEITLISESKFSIFFEGKNKAAQKKIENYFKKSAEVVSEYDELCDSTCIWIHTK